MVADLLAVFLPFRHIPQEQEARACRSRRKSALNRFACWRPFDDDSPTRSRTFQTIAFPRIRFLDAVILFMLLLLLILFLIVILLPILLCCSRSTIDAIANASQAICTKPNSLVTFALSRQVERRLLRPESYSSRIAPPPPTGPPTASVLSRLRRNQFATAAPESPATGQSRRARHVSNWATRAVHVLRLPR